MRCVDIKLSRLKESIKVSEKVTTLDANGTRTFNWNEKLNIAAWLKPTSGRERMQLAKLENLVEYRCVVHYRTDLKESDKITFKGRDFNISYIYNIEEANRFLEVGLTLGGAA